MKNLCNCKDWDNIVQRQYDIIRYSEPHKKWLITWLDLSKNNTSYSAHRYGLVIQFCPFCGKKLNCNNLE